MPWLLWGVIGTSTTGKKSIWGTTIRGVSVVTGRRTLGTAGGFNKQLNYVKWIPKLLRLGPNSNLSRLLVISNWGVQRCEQAEPGLQGFSSRRCLHVNVPKDLTAKSQDRIAVIEYFLNAFILLGRESPLVHCYCYSLTQFYGVPFLFILCCRRSLPRLLL